MHYRHSIFSSKYLKQYVCTFSREIWKLPNPPPPPPPPNQRLNPAQSHYTERDLGFNSHQLLALFTWWGVLTCDQVTAYLLEKETPPNSHIYTFLLQLALEEEQEGGYCSHEIWQKLWTVQTTSENHLWQATKYLTSDIIKCYQSLLLFDYLIFTVSFVNY